MLLQFVVSFAHVHPEDFARLFGEHGIAVVTAPSGDHTPIPVQPDEDGCTICQAMHTVGSSALPGPIVLAMPSETAIRLIAPLAELRLSPPSYFLFNTRAPPIA
jgi:hypothetical protein